MAATSTFEPDPASPASLTARWAALSLAQRALVVVIITAFVVFPLAAREDRQVERQGLLRTQFHLAPDVEFLDFQGGSGKLRWPKVSGVVQFTPAQYNRYVAALDDDGVWTATALEYRRIGKIAAHSPDAFRWRANEPMRRYGGDPLGKWSTRSEARVHGLAGARYFCAAMLETARPPAADGAARAVRVVACSELSSTDSPLAIVKGALDPGARALHMIVI